VLSSANLQTVIETLERHFDLDALWLFGSQAAGRAHAESDLDLAALFARRPSTVALFEVASTESRLTTDAGFAPGRTRP